MNNYSRNTKNYIEIIMGNRLKTVSTRTNPIESSIESSIDQLKSEENEKDENNQGITN